MESNDHDLIIKVATCVEGIKKSVDRIDRKLDNHEDKFISKKMWMWITGLTFTLIFGCYVFTSMVATELHEHETTILETIDEDN